MRFINQKIDGKSGLRFTVFDIVKYVYENSRNDNLKFIYWGKIKSNNKILFVCAKYLMDSYDMKNCELGLDEDDLEELEYNYSWAIDGNQKEAEEKYNDSAVATGKNTLEIKGRLLSVLHEFTDKKRITITKWLENSDEFIELLKLKIYQYLPDYEIEFNFSRSLWDINDIYANRSFHIDEDNEKLKYLLYDICVLLERDLEREIGQQYVLYIYNEENRNITHVVTGNSCEDCEEKASKYYVNKEGYATSNSCNFGPVNSLIKTTETKIIN